MPRPKSTSVRHRLLPGALTLALLALAAACGPAQPDGEATPPAVASPSETPGVAPEPSPTPDPAKWRNGTARCPMPPHVSVPPTGVERGDATQAFCVVWANEYPDESGFRVSVRYHVGGEQFEHTIPPDEHDFVFPPAEAPVPSGPECTARQSYTIEVFVIRPAGAEPVGAVGGVAECGRPQ